MKHITATCFEGVSIDRNAIVSGFYPSVGFEEVARQVHYIMRL